MEKLRRHNSSTRCRRFPNQSTGCARLMNQEFRGNRALLHPGSRFSVSPRWKFSYLPPSTRVQGLKQTAWLVLNFFLKQCDGVHQLLRTRWTSRYIDIDRNDLVHSLD